MIKQKSEQYRLLPFSVIEAASKGDVEAINAVLFHYEGYNSGFGKDDLCPRR